MSVYRHTQFGWFIWGPVIIAAMVLFVVGVAEKVQHLLYIAGLLFLTSILFSTLTVSIDEEKISIAFGIGLIRKKFLFKDIKSANAVRNRWWYGWGIRFIGNGWLFNVSGLDAVELVMENGKVYRIGTDEPQKLLEAIQDRLNK